VGPAGGAAPDAAASGARAAASDAVALSLKLAKKKEG
jgi:hypothetical protein